MKYESYATAQEYCEIHCCNNELSGKELVRKLKEASRHIDALTYNKIVRIGFSNLTDFQKEIIKEVCCKQTEFEFENKDMLNSVMSGYSINGVSVQFDNSANIHTENGVITSKEIYSILSQTGLCCRLI